MKAELMGELPALRAAVPARAPALHSRAVDFWIMGGLALVVWLAFAITYWMNPESTGLWNVLGQYGRGTTLLIVAIQSPHFFASYKLAYGQGRGFVSKNWFHLIAVPIVLLGLFVAAFFTLDFPVPEAVISSMNYVYDLFGFRAPFGCGHMLMSGKAVLQGLINVLQITIGWHFAKQAYGCMMVYARWDGYHLTQRQRDLIRFTMNASWIVNAIWLQSQFDEFQLAPGLTYLTFGLPQIYLVIAAVAFVALLAAMLVLVFWKNWRELRQLPSANFLVPFLALMTWHLPLLFHVEFLFLANVFHGLQYLGFVYKLERTKLATAPTPVRYRKAVLITIGLLGAAVALQILPRYPDRFFGGGIAFFVLAMPLFVALHHYFIDAILWRFQNREVRDYLLS